MRQRSAFLAISQLLLASVVSAENAQLNKRLVQRLYSEVFVKWNLEVVDELVAPDFIGHEMPPGTPPGPQGFRQFYGILRAAFPDLQLTVEDMIAEGDRVVVRWRSRATHKGVFRGIPPTGRDASTTGIAIYRLSKGKVLERWVEVDMLGLTDRLRTSATAKEE